MKTCLLSICTFLHLIIIALLLWVLTAEKYMSLSQGESHKGQIKHSQVGTQSRQLALKCLTTVT